MAHQMTREAIDQAAAAEAAGLTAADEAAATDTPTAETTLAYGAQGDCVTKLVDLLAVLGFATNTVIKGGPPILDESVLVDLRAAKAELSISELEVIMPSEIPLCVKGELVATATWNALYAAAEAKLNPPAPAAGEQANSGAPTGS